MHWLAEVLAAVFEVKLADWTAKPMRDSESRPGATISPAVPAEKPGADLAADRDAEAKNPPAATSS